MKDYQMNATNAAKNAAKKITDAATAKVAEINNVTDGVLNAATDHRRIIDAAIVNYVSTGNADRAAEIAENIAAVLTMLEDDYSRAVSSVQIARSDAAKAKRSESAYRGRFNRTESAMIDAETAKDAAKVAEETAKVADAKCKYEAAAKAYAAINDAAENAGNAAAEISGMLMKARAAKDSADAKRAKIAEDADAKDAHDAAVDAKRAEQKAKRAAENAENVAKDADATDAAKDRAKDRADAAEDAADHAAAVSLRANADAAKRNADAAKYAEDAKDADAAEIAAADAKRAAKDAKDAAEIIATDAAEETAKDAAKDAKDAEDAAKRAAAEDRAAKRAARAVAEDHNRAKNADMDAARAAEIAAREEIESAPRSRVNAVSHTAVRMTAVYSAHGVEGEIVMDSGLMILPDLFPVPYRLISQLIDSDGVYDAFPTCAPSADSAETIAAAFVRAFDAAENVNMDQSYLRARYAEFGADLVTRIEKNGAIEYRAKYMSAERLIRGYLQSCAAIDADKIVFARYAARAAVKKHLVTISTDAAAGVKVVGISRRDAETFTRTRAGRRAKRSAEYRLRKMIAETSDAIRAHGEDAATAADAKDAARAFAAVTAAETAAGILMDAANETFAKFGNRAAFASDLDAINALVTAARNAAKDADAAKVAEIAAA